MFDITSQTNKEKLGIQKRAVFHHISKHVTVLNELFMSMRSMHSIPEHFFLGAQVDFIHPSSPPTGPMQRDVRLTTSIFQKGVGKIATSFDF